MPSARRAWASSSFRPSAAALVTIGWIASGASDRSRSEHSERVRSTSCCRARGIVAKPPTTSASSESTSPRPYGRNRPNRESAAKCFRISSSTARYRSTSWVSWRARPISRAAMKPWTQYAAGMSPPSAQILRACSATASASSHRPEERQGVRPPGRGVEPPPVDLAGLKQAQRGGGRAIRLGEVAQQGRGPRHHVWASRRSWRSRRSSKARRCWANCRDCANAPRACAQQVRASSAALRSRGSSRRSAIARPRPVLASASAMSAIVACAPRQNG